MKWFAGFILGTLASAGFLGLLVWGNGTPVPPVSDWRQVIAFPTGSMATTLELMWIIYFLSFVSVFSLAWAWRRLFRKDHSGDRPASPYT